jgi:hypothetical protein
MPIRGDKFQALQVHSVTRLRRPQSGQNWKGDRGFAGAPPFEVLPGRQSQDELGMAKKLRFN